MRSPHLPPTSLAGAVALALAAATAGAQQPADGGLEEIVVTAQKRAETIQETPVAITAVTGEQLQDYARTSIGSLAVSTPALVYSEAGGEAQIYIRGVGSNIFSVGVDQSVATHVDGVYVARANMGLTQFLDVERVEVLRGPQGTLYGRNATGGAINVISRMPSKEFDGYGSLSFGSFNRRDIQAAVGGGLGGGWSARLAVRGLKDDGYTRDLDSRGSNEIDDNDLKAVRGALRWEGDALQATLLADYSEFQNGNTSIYPLDNAGLAETFGAVPTGSPTLTRNNTPSFHDWQTGGITLDARWKLSDAITLTSITGYREWDSDFLFNTDGTEIEITRSTFVYQSSQKSEELRLAGEHAWGNWLVGAYWLDEDKVGALGLVRAGFTPPTVLSPRAFYFLANGSGTAKALFGQANYRLTDTLSLTAGVRYSDEEKTDDLFSNTIADPELLGVFNPRLQFIAATTRRNAKKSWSSFTPKVGIEWKRTPDQLFYASYTEGFKSGGFNDLSVVNPPFDPEEIKSFEIGAKTDWLDRRLRLNATAFYYDYTDLQVSVFASVGSVTTTITTNAAAAKVQGLELELAAKPTADFEISAAATVLDATYDDFLTPYGNCTAANASLDARCAGRIGLPRLIDAKGNKLNNAPDFKGTLAAKYGFDVGNGSRLTIGAQLTHQGRVFFLPANTTEMSQEAYTLLDARVSWAAANGALEVSAFGKNLTDEEYYHNKVQFTSTSDARKDIFAIGNVLGYAAPGREWGVELLYRFGARK